MIKETADERERKTPPRPNTVAAREKRKQWERKKFQKRGEDTMTRQSSKLHRALIKLISKNARYTLFTVLSTARSRTMEKKTVISHIHTYIRKKKIAKKCLGKSNSHESRGIRFARIRYRENARTFRAEVGKTIQPGG